MKKNTIYCLSLLLVLVIAITSCKTLKTSYNTPKASYTNALPADALMIVSLDVKSILKKAELTEGKNTDLKQKAINLLKEKINHPTLPAIVEKVIQKPEESGINIAAPLYVAFTGATKEKNKAAILVLAKVKNFNKLKSFWDAMASEKMTTPVEKRENYNYVTFAGNNICAFNESVLLIGENDFEKTDKLMSQKETESNVSNPALVKLQERKSEIKYYLNLKPIAKVNSTATSVKEDTKELFDMELFLFMSFEKGKVCMQIDMVTKNENLKKLIEKSTKAIDKQKSVFTDKIPASVFAYMGFNINGEEYSNYSKEIAATYPTNFSVSAPFIEAAKELLPLVKGDVAVALLGISAEGPAICAYAEVEDPALLKKKIDTFQTEKIKPHIGMIDKYLYITNSEEAYQTISKGAPLSDKTLKDTKFASKIKAAPQYMFISVDNILQSPLGLGVGEMIAKPLSQISYLEIIGNNKHTYSGELNFIMKDEKTNALAQIMALIRELSGI
jgi:hypothetical protein